MNVDIKKVLRYFVHIGNRTAGVVLQQRVAPAWVQLRESESHNADTSIRSEKNKIRFICLKGGICLEL